VPKELAYPNPEPPSHFESHGTVGSPRNLFRCDDRWLGRAVSPKIMNTRPGAVPILMSATIFAPGPHGSTGRRVPTVNDQNSFRLQLCGCRPRPPWGAVRPTAGRVGAPGPRKCDDRSGLVSSSGGKCKLTAVRDACASCSRARRRSVRTRVRGLFQNFSSSPDGGHRTKRSGTAHFAMAASKASDTTPASGCHARPNLAG